MTDIDIGDVPVPALPYGAASILACFASADACDELFWRVLDNPLRLAFYVSVSDTFYYACADCEEITSDDIALLWECHNDLHALGTLPLCLWLGTLFVARKRHMRPMHQMLGSDNVAAELFKACGPERSRKDEG